MEHFFNKISVYKQLAFGWQIAKELSGLNRFSLSNNKNYRLKKSGFFFVCNRRKVKYLLNRQYTKIPLPQEHYWENIKISYHKYQFWILKITLFVADIGYLVKLPNNHEAALISENLENISNFGGWGLTLVAYKIKSIMKQWI